MGCNSRPSLPGRSRPCSRQSTESLEQGSQLVHPELRRALDCDLGAVAMLALRHCQSDWSSARRPRFLSRLSSPTLELEDVPRSVARRGIARRSEKWRYTHLQRQGDGHSGSGNWGAASLKKRLSRSPSIAGHAKGPATTLTACHGCLTDAGCFVFVTICRISFVTRPP